MLKQDDSTSTLSLKEDDSISNQSLNHDVSVLNSKLEVLRRRTQNLKQDHLVQNSAQAAEGGTSSVNFVIIVTLVTSNDRFNIARNFKKG